MKILIKQKQDNKLNSWRYKMDKFKEHACDFKNESECEEELEEDGISFSEAESEHFEEKIDG